LGGKGAESGRKNSNSHTLHEEVPGRGISDRHQVSFARHKKKAQGQKSPKNGKYSKAGQVRRQGWSEFLVGKKPRGKEEVNKREEKEESDRCQMDVTPFKTNGGNSKEEGGRCPENRRQREVDKDTKEGQCTGQKFFLHETGSPIKVGKTKGEGGRKGRNFNV